MTRGFIGTLFTGFEAALTPQGAGRYFARALGKHPLPNGRKRSRLGPTLTDAEQEEVIKQHGHPIVVAARYRRPQYLIGPAVFPFYWLILRIAAVSALIVRFVVEVVMALLGPDPTHAIVPALLAVPWVLIQVFFWVTAVFAVFELCSSSFTLNCKKSWSPGSLPTIGAQSSAVSRPRRWRRSFSAAHLFFGGKLCRMRPSCFLVRHPALLRRRRSGQACTGQSCCWLLREWHRPVWTSLIHSGRHGVPRFVWPCRQPAWGYFALCCARANGS